MEWLCCGLSRMTPKTQNSLNFYICIAFRIFVIDKLGTSKLVRRLISLQMTSIPERGVITSRDLF